MIDAAYWRSLGERIHVLRQQAGWPAAAAIAIGACALALSLYWLPGENRAIDADAAAARVAHDQALRYARNLTAPSAPPDEQFRTSFPPAGERGKRVKALLALAAESGLALKRSEYRLQGEAELGIATYRITLPITGSYAAIRAFLEAALREDPALSLDQLRLRRAQPNAPEIQAELQFTLLMSANGDLGRTAVALQTWR